ncbi:MAG: hypothetical protein HQL63_00680 [Magnetococcales bacterium]|nr:hypothetical protein [Magnetococcales bacterium]MBF0322419.1 hypothetical protein [Magnetococcales bacterium]
MHKRNRPPELIGRRARCTFCQRTGVKNRCKLHVVLLTNQVDVVLKGSSIARQRIGIQGVGFLGGLVYILQWFFAKIMDGRNKLDAVNNKDAWLGRVRHLSAHAQSEESAKWLRY